MLNLYYYSFTTKQLSQNQHKSMEFNSVKFAKSKKEDFGTVLNKRVREYFKVNNISRHANAKMIFKSVAVLALYLVPFIVMLTGGFTTFWPVFGLWVIMALGMGGVGFSLMHDANHGAYSKHDWVNKLLSHSLNILGGSPINWQIQHNVLHHSFTNIAGMDEDIAPPSKKLLRFSPHEPRSNMQRYQHLYAWFFYGLMTFTWITSKDFRQTARFNKMGLVKNKSIPKLVISQIFSKIIYYFIFLALPIMLVEIPWWQTLIGFLSMHYVAGVVLGIVFQPAHVVPEAGFPLPEDGSMENALAVHQLLTTTDFAPKSRLLSWYVGGLNFQVEHHLFPEICHIHYPAIAKIVKKTAAEFNLPYHYQETFWAALKKHGQMLKKLGRENLEWNPAS